MLDDTVKLHNTEELIAQIQVKIVKVKEGDKFSYIEVDYVGSDWGNLLEVVNPIPDLYVGQRLDITVTISKDQPGVLG